MNLRFLAELQGYKENFEDFDKLINYLKYDYGRAFEYTSFARKLNIYSDLSISEIKQWLIIMAINCDNTLSVTDLKIYKAEEYKYKIE